ncbi:MAG: Ig-like domain-containing protein [Patescibacteria group bacterium]
MPTAAVSRRGFTLLELLVVIAIISILSTFVLVFLQNSKAKARDVRRLSDLRSIGGTLEIYRIDTGRYPLATAWVSDCGPAGDNWIPDGSDYTWNSRYDFIMPRDPAQNCSKSPAQSYEYWSDGQKYKITTRLESPGSGSPSGGIAFDGFLLSTEPELPVIATLSSPAADPTNQTPIPFSVSFSHAVVDFSAASLDVVNGFISGLYAVGNALYNFFVTPTDNNVITISLSADSVHDQAGTGNTAAQYSILYDSLAPHLALMPDPMPSSVGGPITITLNSTIALSDFSAASVSVQNGTASAAQAIAPLDGRNYSFVVTPLSPGAVTIFIPVQAVHSAAGNGNVSSNILSTTYAP